MVNNFWAFGGNAGIGLGKFNSDFRTGCPRGYRREEEVGLEYYESSWFALEGAVFDMKQCRCNARTRRKILESESVWVYFS